VFGIELRKSFVPAREAMRSLSKSKIVERKQEQRVQIAWDVLL